MKSTHEKLSIVIVNGSVRPGNYTAKATALVTNELLKDERVDVQVVNPLEYDLSFPGLPPGEGSHRLQSLIKKSAGVVLATPEYHGSFSSVIKLVIENLGFPSVLSGKPVVLMGVAAGSIGAIKSLEQLRSVCSHVGAMVLPLPISVAFVAKIFDKNGRCLDPKTEERIRSVATSLMNYIHQNICPRFQLEQLLRQDAIEA
ncbi:MAG: NAD(P)H-dependent oxidoreductase [Bacteroidetes bacterium]|nr:NAD(P)H-dependent oxidoreductase [Bacteroidota bacterium]